MSFSASGSPLSVHSSRLEMPQCFSTLRVKASSFSTFCWMRSGSAAVELVVFKHPGRIETEIDPNVAVLIVGCLVEVGAEAGNPNACRFKPPGRIKRGFLALRASIRQPEHPAHLEFVGAVVMQLFGSFGDRVFDDGCFRVGRAFGAVVVDVDALIGGRLRPIDRVDAGRGYTA